MDASGDATGDASDNASDSVSGSHVGDSDNNSEAAVHADVELKHAHVEREDATAGGTTVTKGRL